MSSATTTTTKTVQTDKHTQTLYATVPYALTIEIMLSFHSKYDHMRT